MHFLFLTSYLIIELFHLDHVTSIVTKTAGDDDRIVDDIDYGHDNGEYYK